MAAGALCRCNVLWSGVYPADHSAEKCRSDSSLPLLLSLESVFSVLAGWVLLGQGLSLKELFGCVLIFCAIILAQLPEKKAV